MVGIWTHCFKLHLTKALGLFPSVLEFQTTVPCRVLSQRIRVTAEGAEGTKVTPVQLFKPRHRRADVCSESALLARLYDTIVWEAYTMGSVGVERRNIYLD